MAMTKSERATKWNNEHPEKSRVHNIINQCRIRAGKKNLPFDLTPKWFVKKESVGVCEATGLPLSKTIGDQFVGSVDRIDPSKGYTQDNCRVVCWIFNRARGEATDEELLLMCEGFIKKYVEKVL